MSYERIQNKPETWLSDRLHFYKYVSAGTAKIVLENRTLRWSAPELFNDPFDAQFDLALDLDIEKIKLLALDKLWQAYKGEVPFHPKNPLGPVLGLLRDSGIKFTREEFEKEYEGTVEEGFDRMLAALPMVHREASKVLRDTKILCLTVKPDNTLMWAHYASSHQGVVLRFRSIPALDSPYGMARPVTYRETIPPLANEELMAGVFAGTAILDQETIFTDSIYTKSPEWAYEEEWRLSAGAGRNPGALFEDVPFGMNELDGVIFGVRTSDTDRNDISRLCRSYPNIQFYQAKRAATKFELEIEPLDGATAVA